MFAFNEYGNLEGGLLLDTLYNRAIKAGDISNEDIERAVLKAHGWNINTLNDVMLRLYYTMDEYETSNIQEYVNYHNDKFAEAWYNMGGDFAYMFSKKVINYLNKNNLHIKMDGTQQKQ